MCRGHDHTHHGYDCPRKLHTIRGHLTLAILDLLRSKPMHGADIHKALSETYGLNVPKAMIYGLLRRMESHGLIISTWDTSESPAKRVYRITEEGLDYLDEAISYLKTIKKIVDKLVSREQKD